MKKIGEFAALICLISLLGGCSDIAEPKTNNSVLQNSTDRESLESSSVPSSFNSGDNSSSTPEYSSVNSAPQDKDVGNGMYLVGAPLDESAIEDFSLAPYIEDYTFGKAEEEFLTSLDVPEIKDLFMRAQTLCRLLSTSNIRPAPAVYEGERTRACIEFDGYSYLESGYTYDSFHNAYLNAFTEEMTEEIFKNHLFLNYNGALFYVDGAKGANAWEVHREYELVSQTDTEIEFKRIVFSHDIDGKPSWTYDLALRDEYVKSYVDFKLVKTTNGWRAEKFLNAEDWTFLVS